MGRATSLFVHSGGRRVFSEGVIFLAVIPGFILVLVLALGGACTGQVLPRPAEAFATLQTRLNLLTGKGFSGVALIERNDEIVFKEAFGSVGGRRVQKNDLFWIASISKSFTAAAVLKCRERGLIRLEDPVARYWPGAPADKQSITISQLLSHTSGLPQSYASENIEDRETAAKTLLKEKLVSAPGSKFNYSNSNYELLAALVEKTSGRKFEEYVRTELLQPLQLTRTGFWFDEQAKQVSPTREQLPSRLKKRGWELGAGGMYSSANDLLHWADKLWSGKVLGEESTRLVFSDHVKIAEGQAGLGWFHGRTGRGQEFWFTRGNDSFGPNALIYLYPALHATIVITSHGGDDQARDMGWSRVALDEVVKVLEF